MANNAIVDIVSFFYPIGNSPAVFLTQDIPCGQKANVLLLGCGDVRNILFTAHAGKGTNQIDLTCCDIEKLVIARNILLFTLILDDEDGSHTKSIWDIYYHLLLGEESLVLLESQARKLCRISDTMEAWHSSSYGKLLHIYDSSTLADVRQIWNSFPISHLGDTAMSAYVNSFRSNLERAKDKRRRRTGKGSVFTGLRAAAPLSSLSFSDFSEIHEMFWRFGTTSENDQDLTTHPNPMFASQVNDSFTLHYGTDPLLGFHLASAYAPVSSRDNLEAKGLLRTSPDHLVRMAQQQFTTWCTAFRERSGQTMVIRFFVGEALAFCDALQRKKTSQDFPGEVYRKPGSFEPLLMDGEDYGSDTIIPVSFNVIDTSNLIDHVGAVNLLVSSTPLLDDTPSATLYTESLVRREKDHSALAENFLCGHVLTMSILLSLFPVEYLTNVVSASTADETLWDSTARISGEERDPNGQMYSRLCWKKTAPTISRVGVLFEEKDLAGVLFEAYTKMFQHEDARYLFSMLNPSFPFRRASSTRYHRGSFVHLLRFVKSRNVVNDWKKTMDCLIGQIEDDTNLLTGRNHIQELYVQLHVHKIYSVPILLAPLQKHRLPRDSKNLGSLRNPPEVVCINLEVPREYLKVLTDLKQEELGTPAVHCILQSSNAFPGRPWQNIFSVLRFAFGKIYVSGSVKDNTLCLEVDEDERGWLGDSSLFVSFHVPTWVTLLDFPNAKLAFGIQSSPRYAAIFSPILGHEMNLYETRVGNEDHVFVTANPPRESKNSGIDRVAYTFTGRHEGLNCGVGPSVKVNLSQNSAQVKSLTGRVEIGTEKARSLLRDGAKVRVVQESLYSISVLIGKGDVKYDINYPIAVLVRQSRTRIARKSSYIEVEAPVLDPSDAGGIPQLIHPVLPTHPCPTLWNMPRVNLKALEILDSGQKERMKWLVTHCSLMFSGRERSAREGSTSTMDVRTRYKDSLFSIFMHQTGLQGQKAAIFGFNNPSGGEIHVLLFGATLRLDPCNHTVVLDAAVLVLTDKIMPQIHMLLSTLNFRGLCSIKVDDEELQLWKEALPAFVERCRRWQHRTTCEYLKASRIPLSTKLGESPICSCGEGEMLDEIIEAIPELGLASRFAVRAAISPSFSSPFVEPSFDGRVQRDGSDSSCWNCSARGSVGGTDLQRCSRCCRARYCSIRCQRADWKDHKKWCGGGL